MSHPKDKRWLLVDASVFISLSSVDALDTLMALRGRVIIPDPVKAEISDDPARSALNHAIEEDLIETCGAGLSPLLDAAEHLGRDLSMEDIEGYGHRNVEGDIAILAIALQQKQRQFSGVNRVVVSDDKPLRKACKMLSIPVSGSIGTLIRAVERGQIGPEEAKETLYSLDEVGARLSASLVQRAERMIDDVAMTD